MEDLATLTTALSVPRIPWFTRSILPPRWGSRDADHGVVRPAKSRVYLFNFRSFLALASREEGRIWGSEIYHLPTALVNANTVVDSSVG